MSSREMGGFPPRAGRWLAALRRYLLLTGTLDLVWETAQLPLYTIWTDGTARTKAFAIIHCTAGDILIALVVLVGTLLIAGHADWPGRRAGCVALLTVVLGLAYTVFSEWLNVSVRRSWAYSDLMPMLPPLGTGLSPVVQWLVVPTVALWMAHRGRISRTSVKRGSDRSASSRQSSGWHDTRD